MSGMDALKEWEPLLTLLATYAIFAAWLLADRAIRRRGGEGAGKGGGP